MKNEIKKISDFLFFELSSKIGVIFQKNDTKMVIIQKIKIVEFWNLVLLSIQPIADILRKKKLKKKKKKFPPTFFLKKKKKKNFLDFEENP